jgi:AcrR family transcriptional regulator
MHARLTRRTKTAASSLATRHMIAAARRQFFVHGFRRVSMDDLAAELRISKKTLYASFPSKSSLVEAVLKAKFDEVEADLSRLASEHSSDMEEAIHGFLQRVQRHTSEIHPPFVRDLGRETPELFRIVEHRRRRLIRRHVGGLFKKGRKAGLIRRDIPVHLLIEILLGAVEAIITPTKVTELGLTLERGYSTVIRVILEGAIERRSRP